MLQVSAGGVAFRRVDDHVEVALISVGPDNRWQLPKGMLTPGEKHEAAGMREVREEAGIETEFVAPLERIEYWYGATQRGRRVRFHKYVYFFLLRYQSGDPNDHDDEVNEACWVEIDQAIDQLAYENERRQVILARELIQTLS